MPRISPNITRICKICGCEYHPKSTRQVSCNRPIKKKCVVCGKEFDSICTISETKITCSSKCSASYIKEKRKQSALLTTKTCKWCGKEFHPKSVRDVYCYDKHYQVCEVCGEEFEIDVRKDPTVRSCSDECKKVLLVKDRDFTAEHKNLVKTLEEKYGVDNIAKLKETQDKIKETNRKRYGVDFYTQTEEYKDKVKKTSLDKYGTDHHLKNKEVIEKRKETCLEKYGVDNVSKTEEVKRKISDSLKSIDLFKSYYEKTGYHNPQNNPEVRSKSNRSKISSEPENKVERLLQEYSIKYIKHHMIECDGLSHEYDFYLPDYKILIDIDGLYYHGYLDDPNGKQIIDEYDELRFHIIPKDHILYIIQEHNEEKAIKNLMKFFSNTSFDLKKYDSKLFNWCREIEFPYPSYNDNRLHKDYKKLCEYSKLESYNSHVKLAMSSIRMFHRSLYNCRVGNFPTIIEAWNDDKLLKKAIANRCIYEDNLDPSKVLKGFNVAKIAPKVSVFNPLLAKYLGSKYLQEFDQVFDPFSGFSGRLLGISTLLNKKYIGQDINETIVKESNEIIKFHNLHNVEVTTKDVYDSEGSYQCLLTCPPYFKKEIYGNETVFNQCDEWIDVCLDRFTCQKYVFVVDETSKYSKNIVEEIVNKSHFGSNTELVIEINK